jgi:predicted nucleotidyltransferase
MSSVDRKQARIYRSFAEAEDHGYMPGTPEERLSQVWELTQEAWSFLQGAHAEQRYREMLQCLLEEKVRFLLVGAYAVAVHGFPRATKDIDFFVWATPENATNLIRALARFGAPLDKISESDIATAGIVFQIGNSPRRIDIITTISGVEFERAYANRKNILLEGLEIPVISVTDLIANKRASGRAQDLADVEKLESATKRE